MVSEVPATVWEGALADGGRARRPIFGVGYGGRSIGEITDLLGEMRIDEVADTATCRRVAVLCACRGGDRCHRRLVLARLSARYSFVEAEL